MQPTLDIEPQTSGAHSLLMGLVTGLALVGLWWGSVPLELKIVLSLAIFLSGLDGLLHIQRAHPLSVRRIQRLGGQWWLTLRNGQIRKVQLNKGRVVLSWFVHGVFTDGEQLFPITVTRDVLTQTEHRRLRAAVLLETDVNESPVSRWYDDRVRRMWRS